MKKMKTLKKKIKKSKRKDTKYKDAFEGTPHSMREPPTV